MANPTWKDGLALVGDCWHYRFWWDGRLFKGSTGLPGYRDARQWVEAFRRNLARAEVGIQAAPTVKSAFEDWHATWTGKLSAGHLQRVELAFRLWILPVYGSLRCDQITDEVAELIRTRYLEKDSYRHAPHSVEGANTLLKCLKIVLIHAIGKAPFTLRRLKPQQRPKPYLTRQLIPAFLEELDRTGNLHVSIAVRAMLYLGLRESEALGMRWEWFSPDQSVYTPGRTKGKEAIPLPVPADLRLWLARLTTLSPWVLPAEDGCPHRPQLTKKPIARAGAKVKLTLTPHDLRRTWATLAAQAGVDIRTIQAQLRHKQITTTMAYIQTGLDQRMEAAAKMWGA